MATIQELLDLAYQIRDAEQNGENTALRVGQFLVELVNHFNTKADVDNISGAYHLKQQQAPIMALMSVQQMPDSNGQDNKAWWSTDGHIKYQHNGRIYDLGTPAYMLYYCGDKIYKWSGSATGFKLMTDGGGGSSGGGASVFANFAVAASTNELPDNGVATTGYIVGQNLYAYVGTGGDTKGGKYQNLGELNAAGVSLTTNGDGTFTVHSGGNDYTVNLNHTHPNMAKLIVCEESDLPSTLDNSTIYAITDSGETEIEKLIIRGMEFAGGGGSADDGLPKMVTPKDESTINLGSIEEGETATKDIPVRAKNLNYGGSTTGLTVEAVGTGLSLTYGQTTDASVTIPQADAMIGASLRITYSGSSSLNGELRFKQGSSVLASVVVVVVVVDYYSGIEYNKKAAVIAGSGTVSESISTDSTKCITPIYDLGGGNHVIKIRFGYTGQLIGLNGYDSSNNFIEQWTASANERTVNLYNNVTKVRATLQQADLDNCYIYDVTAAKWLFKGNNVTQIPS